MEARAKENTAKIPTTKQAAVQINLGLRKKKTPDSDRKREEKQTEREILSVKSIARKSGCQIKSQDFYADDP